MAQSFAELLKNRKKDSETLSKKVEELKKGGTSYDKEPDPRIWTGTKHLKNKDGNGRATIRFLPAPMGEENAFVLYYSYFHKHQPKNAATVKYYVENSLKTFGNDEKDPAYDYNGTIWADTSLSDDAKKKKQIRRQKKYVSNILVVDDPVKPEYNGKVMIFEYGPEIYKLIEARMHPDPSVSKDKPANPFDPLEGCNFELKIVSKKIDDSLVPSYASSTFEQPAPFADSEEEMERIWNSCYPLAADFLDRAKYAPYEKQLKNFIRVFGFDPTPSEDAPKASSKPKESKEEAPKKSLKEEIDDEIPFSGSDSKDDEPPFDVDDKTETTSDDDDDDFFSRFKQS
jgi:hypothetical protein